MLVIFHWFLPFVSLLVVVRRRDDTLMEDDVDVDSMFVANGSVVEHMDGFHSLIQR